MRQNGRRPLLLWLLLACGVPLVLGCRAIERSPDETPASSTVQALEPSAASALSEEEAGRMLSEAEQAFKDGDYSAAIEHLNVLRANAQALSAEQADLVDTLLGRARNARHQEALAAREQAAEVAPVEAPDVASLGAEEAALRATELLDEATRLWNERKYGQAAGYVNALDPLRPHLSEADRLLYDELSRVVRLTTQQVRALSDPDRHQRALEHLQAGLRARQAGDYPTASSHLRMAALFDADLGWRANRQLRRACDEVETALQEARQQIAHARRWLEVGELEQAQQALQSVRGQGILAGPQSEELDRLLARVEEGFAERERREAEQLQAQAADLLERAAALCESGDFENAGALLAELQPLAPHLSAEAEAHCEALRDAVENATGIRPGLSDVERRAVAREQLERGLEAHDQKRYADARLHLDRVARLDVDLGWRANRRLRRARERIEEDLGRLQSRHQLGRRLFETGDYAGAREVLQEIADSRIQIGQPDSDDVINLLAAIEQKERESLQAQQAEAGRLLSEARELAARQDYAQAKARLEALDRLGETLSPAQKKESAALLASIREAEVRAKVEREWQEAERLATQASELLTARNAVEQKLTACDEAVGRHDFPSAAALLAQAQALLDEADATNQPALSTLAERVGAKAGEVEAARKRQVHLQAVAARLDELAAQAAQLSRTDLLAAERKMKEMLQLAGAEQAPLSAEQAAVRDAIVSALHEAYRIDRWLRPAEYGRLLAIAEQYALAGEHEKAVRVLALVKDAPADMVSEEYRSRALGRLLAAQSEADQQDSVAGRLVAACADARARLAAGDPAKALAGAAGVLQTAEQQKLSGAALIRVLEEAVTLLGTDFVQAMEGVRPELKDHVERELARARVAVAEQLSPLYLNANSPELAEPHLRVLANAGEAAPAPAQWARAQLTLLERMKAEAEQARLKEIGPDTERARNLAERLLELTQAGKVAEAEAAGRELADLRVTLHVKRARHAQSRGAYDEAAGLLAAAPVSEASEPVVTNVYQPAAAEIGRARDVVERLRAAEQALEACDVERAAEQLAVLQAGGVLPQPFEVRKQALASVAESALQVRESQLALSAEAERELDRARKMLSDVRLKEQAWQGYHEKMEAFLTGRDTKSGPLRTVLAQPAGLREFELAEVRNIVAVLVEEEQKRTVAQAAQLLARAVVAYNAADYLGTSAALEEVKAHAGFALSEEIRQSVKQVEEAVQEKEREAQALFDEAVAARRANDAQRVREALDELRAKYGKTRAYRDRM